MRISLVILAFLIGSLAFGQTAKIKELEVQRKQMLLEISNTDKLLRETKKTASTLLTRIKLIAGQIASRKQVITLLEDEISSIDVQQRLLEKEIKELDAELVQKRESYAKTVDAVLRNRQNQNKLLFILSGKSLAESYRRLRYLREYSEYRSNQADEIKAKQEERKQKQEALTRSKAEKVVLLSQREAERSNLQKEEQNYQANVKEAQEKQKDLQKVLAEKKKQAEKLNREIERLIAEDIARKEAEARKRAEALAKKQAQQQKQQGQQAGRDKQPLPKDAIAEADIKLSGSFAANRGQLPMPITGRYVITTRFGTHQHQQWKHVSTSSSGIDLQSQAGAQARCVFDGEVTMVANMPGYNNCVIVRHGGYYTFYGNISTLSVKKGDKVKTNQSLGTVYTDPDTNRSELHFQLWKGTTKQNPEPWLRK